MKACNECGADIVKGKFCSKKCSAQHRAKHTFAISKEDLVREYEVEKLELAEIGQRHGVSVITICNYLKRYGIEKRVNYLDFSNQRIGSLQVFEPVETGHKGGGKHIKWNCVCDCGCDYIASSQMLNSCVNARCLKCVQKAHRSPLELKQFMWSNIKRGATNRKLDFLIERDWAYQLFLRQGRKCALSGVEIGFAECAADFNRGLTTASLDRKDSSKGYTEENVQWIHKAVNFMKGSMSDHELLEWCGKIMSYSVST